MTSAGPPNVPDRAAAVRAARNWFSPQPNVTGRGIVAGYSARFWAIVVVLGAVTGIGAVALVGLLHLVEHLAYGYRSGPFLDGVAAAAGWRHVVALVVAAFVVWVGLLLLQRLPTSGGAEVSEALWLRGAQLAFIPSVARSVLSIVTVGLGVSLGREGAPQLVGAATASRLADWAALPTWQRRLLVASGAGAGFAAVYNVPLGGALFALEVLLGTIALPLVLPALATSVVATAVAWIGLGTGPTYRLPPYGLHPTQLVWAVLVGPIIGVVAIGWVRLVQQAGALRPRRWGRLAAPLIVFTILGVVSIQYPQLLGNGKGVVQLEALGGLSLGLLCVLFVLKPLATVACLGAGSPGGSVHALADRRRPAGRGPRLGVEPHLAGRRPRQLRGHRRRRLSGGVDAGAAVGRGARVGAHAELRLADGADARGGDRGDGHRPAVGRALDLLGPVAPRSRCPVSPVGGRGGDQHPRAGWRIGAGGRARPAPAVTPETQRAPAATVATDARCSLLNAF